MSRLSIGFRRALRMMTYRHKVAVAIVAGAVVAGAAVAGTGIATAPVIAASPGHTTAALHSSAPATTPAIATVTVKAAAVSPAHMQTRFLALLNGHRRAHHVRALKLSHDLVLVAKKWSRAMAGDGVLRHNPHLATQVANWEVVGENVGDGTDVPTLDRAFWKSPEHRANILYATFTQVGIGVIVSHGTVWVTLDFRQPLH